MAAALGTCRFLGKTSNKIYAVSTYLNDTAANPARFDQSKIAVAGSNDYVSFQEHVTLIDVCLTSDIATPTHLQIIVNGNPTGDILDATAHLASVVNRPNPAILVMSGSKFQMTQIS